MKIKEFFKKIISRHDLKQQAESGRSMIEMLGVLVLIGLLSVGGISLFKYTLNFWEARNIQSVVTQSKVLAVTKQARQRTNDDGTFRNAGLTRFLKRTPLKGYAENVNAMLNIKQGKTEKDFIYLIHLQTVPFEIQKFIWRDKTRFAEVGIAINPTQELINEFEDELDGQTTQTREAWITYGMNADIADSLEPELGIESNEQITFLFNISKRVGRGTEVEITPPEPDEDYCATHACDCKGQHLPYYVSGVVIECGTDEYYDGELGRCVACNLPECVVGTKAEKAEDCYEWEEFVAGCCVKKNNPSPSDLSDSPDLPDPNENCTPDNPYYDEETGKCVSRCQLGKKFLSDWKACISCDYNGAVTIDDTTEGRGYCTGCILTADGSRQVKKNAKNETYCVYNSCTPGLELQLKSGECQACDPGSYPISVGEGSTGSEYFCRACGGEVLSTGYCRIPCPTGQYMDKNGKCHSCEECTGYNVGWDNSSYTYYRESCLACGNKEINSNYYCIDKGQFGWEAYSSSVGAYTFMCKECVDIPKAGISYSYITQSECEMCGLWEKQYSSYNICCPEDTFYSYYSSNRKCHACDTPDSIRMYDSGDRQNCETFCGDQRVLINKSGTYYCDLKKQCAEGELFDIDDNQCYACDSDKTSIHIGTGSDAMSDCTACGNREYQNGYCVLACLDNQYRDSTGNCHDCNECTGYKVSTTDASTCTTACTNRKIRNGYCVLNEMPTGQYMDTKGQCHSCDGCTGYDVGSNISLYTYYRESCLACANKEINSMNYCIDKEQFGWVSSGLFMCKECADIPEEGIYSYSGITKEECEICGLWERTSAPSICCPRDTFFSEKTMKCHACNTPDSIEMSYPSFDGTNCETFCGDKRTLANKNGKYYCELKTKCGEGELYDIDENKCYPCDSNKGSIHVGTGADAMSDCTACGNREYQNGYCVLLCLDNQYRDSAGNCHNCDECTGYSVGSNMNSMESCLACANKEINSKNYCIDKGQFGWEAYSSSVGAYTFMCKECVDIPKAGISYSYITQSECEMCGLWEKQYSSYNICCPEDTFYSYYSSNRKCHACDTPDSIRMYDSGDRQNCETFCGDQRVLINKSGTYYCDLKTQCAEGQILNTETNTCHDCWDATNIPIDGDETVRNWCLNCRIRRVEVDKASGAENCVMGACSANGNGDSQFIGNNGYCYTCDYATRVRIDTNNADMQSTLQDLCKGSDKCGRTITTIGNAIYCDPKCVSGEEYRDETGYCSTCSGLTPDNSPITDSAESRALCAACGGTFGTPEGLTGLYCIK